MIKDKGEKVRDFLLILIITFLVLCAFLAPTKASGQCSGPIIDTVQGSTCKFVTLDTVVNAGDVVNYCFWFKPETADLNMTYMLVQSSSCGPNVYQYLKFKIFVPTCDTIVWQGNIYPTPANTYVQGLDTSRWYVLCLGWKALCQQDAICARYAPSPLPVTLEYFSAEVKEDAVQLEWVTKSEINNDFFQIQKADSTFKFMDFQRVQGNGNITYPVLYRYLDYSPIHGISYYRLLQQDYDGTIVEYRPIAIVYKSNIVTVQPTIIYNILGQKLYESKTK